VSAVADGSGDNAVEPGTGVLLRAENITAGYGETVVLRDVSLTVRPSSVVALLGPNGAGKTTLLRTISGLMRPMSGHVWLGTQEITRRPAEFIARAGLCHVPEGRGIFPSLTVRENLILQAKRGAERDGIERIAAIFPELGRRLGQVAGSMSGGEQQMLALARATLSEPSLVVVNEASLGLPPYWPTGWTRASSSTRDPLATAAIPGSGHPRQRPSPGSGHPPGAVSSRSWPSAR